MATNTPSTASKQTAVQNTSAAATEPTPQASAENTAPAGESSPQQATEATPARSEPSAVVSVPVPGIAVTTPVRPTVRASMAVTPAKVESDATAAKVEQRTATPAGIFEKYSTIVNKMSVSSQMRFTRLAAYIDSMKPGKPLNDVMGASYQRVLLDVITGIINSAEDFNSAFGVLVQIVNDNRKGCFADTHAGRFVHALIGSADDRQAFQRLVNLLIVLGGANETSLAKRQVNLQHATEYCISAAGRERVIEWVG